MFPAFMFGFISGLLDGIWKVPLKARPRSCQIGDDCAKCQFFVKCCV